MRDDIDQIVRRRPRRTLDNIREDLDSTLQQVEEDLLENSSTSNPTPSSMSERTILGRDRGAESRLQQLQSRNLQTHEHEPQPEPDEDEEENVLDAQEDEGEREAHEGREGDSTNISQVGFFGRLILMGLAGIVIFTVGKYAFDSLLDYNRDKALIDATENYQILMGQDIEPTEDVLAPVTELIETGTIQSEIVVPYTYNKWKKIVKFEACDVTFSIDPLNYTEHSFHKEGYLTLLVTKDMTGTLLEYEIMEVV